MSRNERTAHFIQNYLIERVDGKEGASLSRLFDAGNGTFLRVSVKEGLGVHTPFDVQILAKTEKGELVQEKVVMATSLDALRNCMEEQALKPKRNPGVPLILGSERSSVSMRVCVEDVEWLGDEKPKVVISDGPSYPRTPSRSEVLHLG